MRFCLALFLAIVVVIIGNGVTNIFVIDVVDAKNASPPELTSTALKLNNVYTNFPPHDTDLYDTLEVSSNATLSQITKSYRTLSRIFHPDKQKQKKKKEGVAEKRLQQIQRSYEILGNDNKRLLYHRYGLTDPNLAAFILLGPKINPKSYYQLLQQTSSSYDADGSSKANAGETHLFDKLDRELLQLMGYDDSTMDVVRMAMETNPSDDPSIALEDHRVRTVAAILVESIRPVVEGRLDTRLYVHSLANDCDRWKRLPLGAQIIRSIGRAYRHEGNDFLQRYKSLPNNNYWNKNNLDNNNNSKQAVRHFQTDLTIGLRRKWRTTKDFWTAAAVGGRLAMAERLYNKQEQQQKRKQKQQKIPFETIEYHGNEEEDEASYLPHMDDYGHDDDVDCYESMEEEEEKHREFEKLKAQQTLLQALQIEALWKVVKIDLDRIIRRACAMILSGEYFFFPSHQSLDYSNNNFNNNNGIDIGWVTSSGETIDLEQAIVTAAETIIMTGEIMVQQSKEGTSWKE
jgi:hypothetical protein